MLAKLKYIIALCFISGFAYGQSTTGWSIVTTEGTNLYQDGVSLASGITNYFTPAYGVFNIISDPFIAADSSIVSNGTVTAGTVTNTWVEDGDYYTVQETGVFEIYFLFSNSATASPREMNFHGRYEGNPSHDVLAEVLNKVTGEFDSMTGDGDDVPSGSTDSTYKWGIPSPQTNYIDAFGQTFFRFIHDGSAVSSHYMYMDYLAMTYASAILPTAGVWYAMTDVGVDATHNIITDTTNACITTINAGMYRIGWYASFTGSSNTIFTIRAVTNGSPTDIEMWRSIGSEPAIGSASAFGYEYEAAGTTNCWELKANTDNAWFTIVNGHAEVKKVSN